MMRTGGLATASSPKGQWHRRTGLGIMGCSWNTGIISQHPPAARARQPAGANGACRIIAIALAAGSSASTLEATQAACSRLPPAPSTFGLADAISVVFRFFFVETVLSIPCIDINTTRIAGKPSRLVNTSHSHPGQGNRRLFGVQRYSSVELLVSLVLFIIATPFVEEVPHGKLIEAGLMTVMLSLATLAVGGRRQTLVVCIVLLVPALIGKWLKHLHPTLVPSSIFPLFGLAFMAFVVFNLLRHILRASRVDTEVLCAAISAYLMLGLLWMEAYMLVGQLSPDAFLFSVGPEPHRTMTGFEAFYFSFVTLSTVGYGDITPLSKVARMLAVLEAMVGLFFITLLVARLVSMYAPGSPKPSSPDPE